MLAKKCFFKAEFQTEMCSCALLAMEKEKQKKRQPMPLDDVVVHHQSKRTLNETCDHHDHLICGKWMGFKKTECSKRRAVWIRLEALNAAQKHKAQTTSLLAACKRDVRHPSRSKQPEFLGDSYGSMKFSTASCYKLSGTFFEPHSWGH